MKLFNGIITIASTPEEVAGATSQWSFEAAFQSNDGFLVSDIELKDVIVLNGYDINTDESQYCRYIVEKIEPTSTIGHVKLTVSYDEEIVDDVVFAPSDADENKIGLIGRKTSENGFTFLPTAADGVDEASLEKARNIDLKKRDELFAVYVDTAINEIRNSIGQGGSSEGGSATDDTKLPIAGGTITGDLTVENQTTLNKTHIKAGDTSVNVTSDGVKTAISSVNAIDTKTVESDNAIEASVSRVSHNGASNVTDLANGATAERLVATRATETAMSSEEVSSVEGEAKHILNVKGTKADIQINATGRTSSHINVSADKTHGLVEVEAKNVNLNGEVTVTGAQNVSDNVTANKLFMTSEDTEFADNQLVSNSRLKSYVISYVAEKIADATNGGLTKSEVEEMLKDYVTNVALQSLLAQALAEIPPANILTNDDNLFVSAAQVSTWNNKMDTFDLSKYETVDMKGGANGYAPLNENSKIPDEYLPFSTMLDAVEPVKFMDSDSFDRHYNTLKEVKVGEETKTIRMGDLKGSLFVVFAPNDEVLNGDGDLPDWRFVGVYSANQEDVTLGRAEAVGQQLKHEFGTYNSSRKLIDWKSIANVPTSLVQTDKNGKISEDVLPEIGARNYGGIQFDKYGRPESYTTPEGGTGSNSGGAPAMQWYRVPHANGDDLLAYYGTGEGITAKISNNKIDITVPKGVSYRTLQVWIDEDHMPTGGIDINLDVTKTYIGAVEPTEDGTVIMTGPIPTVDVFRLDGGIGLVRDYTYVYNGDGTLSLGGDSINENEAKMYVIRL